VLKFVEIPFFKFLVKPGHQNNTSTGRIQQVRSERTLTNLLYFPIKETS